MGSMFGGSKPPPPPDPALQSQRQQQDIQRSEQQQQNYNRPEYQQNQFGGTTQWRQTGVDANGNPTFSVVQGLSDPSQNYLGGMQALGNAYAGAAANFLGNRPDLSSGAALDQATQFATQEAQRQYGIQRNQLDTQLRNQGLQPGTEAYNNAMQNLDLTQQRNIAATAAGVQNQFFNQGLANRGEQQGEFQLFNPSVGVSNTALTAGSPNFSGINVGTADTAGLYNQNFNQQMQIYQQQMQQQNAMLGGLAGLGGTILGGPVGGYIGKSLFGGSASPAPNGWPTSGIGYGPMYSPNYTQSLGLYSPGYYGPQYSMPGYGGVGSGGAP